ncbi:MAG: hypothetical protein NC543_06895 [bacterium]|nr:hypothetical protein [bacterium]MCM1376286.1 hypothetical protein [Muribaculum sp.]
MTLINDDKIYNRMAALRKMYLFCLLVFPIVLSGCGGIKEDQVADTYRCAVSSSFYTTYAKLYQQTSSRVAFCPGSAVRCNIYPADDTQGQYTEVSVIRADGEQQTYTWKAEEGKQIIGAGVVIGANEFVTFCDEADRCYLERRNWEGDILERSILAEFSDHLADAPVMAIVDGNGYVHIDDWAPTFHDTVNWCIYAPDGSVFHEERYAEHEFLGLMALHDGRVVCQTMISTPDSETKIECVNTDNGEKEIIFSCGKENVSDQDIYVLGLFGDGQVAFLNQDGIYLCDDTMENARQIFTWKQNGMYLIPPMQAHYGICTDTAGNVFILAEMREGMSYQELQPMPENVVEIELASAGGGLCDYYEAVLEFNKAHPECRIVIRDDYDKTALLTKLMAGDGPVIIDVYAIPNWRQEKIWEPLENLVGEQTLGELNQAALKLGNIGGTPYAAVSSFFIDTLVTCEDIGNWDYEAVTKCARGRENMQSILTNDGLSKIGVMFTLFVGGEDDTYFVDAGQSDHVIDKDKLTEAIQLIEQYGQSSEEGRSAEAVREGRILCGREVFAEPYHLCGLKLRYGENAKCIGFPHADGGRHHLTSAGVLAVRKNATDEEKKIAAEFFETLLSYDVQSKTVSGGLSRYSFSVRNDILEQQIEKTAEKEGLCFGSDDAMYVLGPVDVDELRRELYEILENSIPSPNLQDDYHTILVEEFGEYFSGNNSLEMLTDHLNNRLKLYFGE